MISSTFYFPPGHSAAEWSDRHSAGDVPDRWLYGIDRLADGQLEVDPQLLRTMCTGSKISSLVSAVVPRRPRKPSIREPQRLHVAWDELRATHMLSQIRDVERAACGAIWCIDEQLRQPMNPKNLIIRETLRSMEYVWCLVDDQRPLLQEWIGPGSAVHYVPFGIDTDFFEYRTMPESTKPLIVSLGNDRDRDGHTLVNSLEIILQKHKSARAMVQCDARLRLPDRAQRLPRLNHIEVRKLYQQCSIVLLPTKPNTHFSGMTVALEAMATGRPVVATDTLGARDYIADKSTGCLAASAEPEQFASLVLHLLAEPDTARQLGERAATKVRENFKSSDMVNDLRALLTNSATAARRDRPRES